jgi:iduronate 2-sulfatase
MDTLNRREFIGKSAAAAAVTLIPDWAFADAASDKPRNVLFITIDDLRPELASYKADGIRTPNIDRLAAKGLQFNAAYCQYPVCNPSRSSLLTGLRPDELGILSNRIALRHEWPDLVTLPQAYRRNGYFTAGLGKLFHVGTDEEGEKTFFRDDASFDHFYKAMGSEPEIGREGEGRKLGDGTVNWAQWRAAEGGDEAQADGMLAAEAVRMLEEHHDEPFFIGVGFHKPHDPFVAPKEYFDLYPLDEVKLAENPADRTPILKHALPNAYNFDTFTDQDRREFKRAYHACTTFVDAQVGKLLDAMDRLELWKNTTVVLLGDHGYHLGEHGWWNKVTVFDIGARVPLVVWAPESAGMGAETEAVVELLDIYPTLAGLSGVEPPHELRGESLTPILEDPNAGWDRPAFTQVVRGSVGMGYSVRYGDWRLTQWGEDGAGGLELYDVIKDKEGYYNHASNPEYAATVGQLHGFLMEGYPQLRRGSG